MPDGRILIAGGNTGSAFTNRCFIYDPATWQVAETTPSPSAVGAYSLVSYGDGILKIGGSYRENWPTPVNETFYFDINTQTWSPGPSLPEPTMWACAENVDGDVVVCGGYSATLDGPSGLTFKLRYDGGSGTSEFEVGASMPRNGVWGGGSAVIDGNLLSYGGVDQ